MHGRGSIFSEQATVFVGEMFQAAIFNNFLKKLWLNIHSKYKSFLSTLSDQFS